MAVRVTLVLLASAVLAGAVVADEKPKIISKAIDPGRLITTSKIGVADGLLLSVSFVVINPSEPDAKKLKGMAGLAFIENLTTVKDYRLTQKSDIKLVRGKKEFSLTKPKVGSGDGVKSLDFASFTASELFEFLQGEGKLGVVVDGKQHDLSESWTEHVDDLIKEVKVERKRAGYDK